MILTKSEKFISFLFIFSTFIFACNAPSNIIQDENKEEALKRILGATKSTTPPPVFISPSNKSTPTEVVPSSILYNLNDPNKKPVSITITVPKLVIKKNEFLNLYDYIEVTYLDGEKDRDFLLINNNSNIGSLDVKNGFFRALNQGKAEIIAKSNKNNDIYTKINIDVSNEDFIGTSTGTDKFEFKYTATPSPELVKPTSKEDTEVKIINQYFITDPKNVQNTIIPYTGYSYSPSPYQSLVPTSSPSSKN